MDIINLLKEKLGNENVLENELMSKHTSFKVGGPADIFVKVDNIEKLQCVLNTAADNKLPVFILGNGSNVLVTDKGIRGIVCKIELNIIEVTENGEDVFVTVGSGMKNAVLAQKLLNMEVTGFEFASGIPGTIGGAIKMNAGAYGKEIKDIVVSTRYMDHVGNISDLSLEEHEFSYRNSVFHRQNYIILDTILKLKKGKKEEIEKLMEEYKNSRKEKQPYDKPSAGSTFKRGENYITAKLIDECRLKGKQIGGAKVSDKHAGFIVNEGNATASDIIELIGLVKKTVHKQTGKQIDLEIEIVGEMWFNTLRFQHPL